MIPLLPKTANKKAPKPLDWFPAPFLKPFNAQFISL